jgi:hypothetical protein
VSTEKVSIGEPPQVEFRVVADGQG